MNGIADNCVHGVADNCVHVVADISKKTPTFVSQCSEVVGWMYSSGLD